MDPDISRWVLEFLLRSSAPDSLINKTLTVLPLSAADSRLKKTLLLRTLHSQLSKASLTETSLQILELLEELYRNKNDAVSQDLDRTTNDAVSVVTDSMRSAYCAVAVECTVKYLAASPDDAAAGEYFDAVRRIWRGRVREMEVSRRSELLCDELTRWRDEIEAAVWDPRVCERLAGLNSRREALKKVKEYLKEAWENMGPSFLDSVAKLSKGKGKNGLCPEGVCEFALGVETIGKERREFGGGGGGGDRSESDDNDDDDDDGGACCMEDDDVAVRLEGQGKEQSEERVENSVDGNQELGECDLPAQGEKANQKGNRQLKRKHSALRACHRGVKISGAEEVGPGKSWSKYDPVPSPEVKKVRESLKTSSLELRALVKDPLPDALHTSEVVRSKLGTKDINHEAPVENQSEDVELPDPNVCKSIVLFQPNDANLGKKSSVRCSIPHQQHQQPRPYSNAYRPNLMERRSTARIYEWDDSMDNLPQGRQPKRRKRKWTSLEEETLRDGVKMFGEGNWATIRNFYSNIFENRSGVDLKDKWRNMMR